MIILSIFSILGIFRVLWVFFRVRVLSRRVGIRDRCCTSELARSKYSIPYRNTCRMKPVVIPYLNTWLHPSPPDLPPLYYSIDINRDRALTDYLSPATMHTWEPRLNEST